MCIRDRYGLHMQHVNVSNTAEVMDKLSKHEIDCFVSVEASRWEESDICLLYTSFVLYGFVALAFSLTRVRKHWWEDITQGNI